MSDTKYTVTVYAAAPGTPLLDPETGQPKMEDGKPVTSLPGHMFYVISDGRQRESYGFAPIQEGQIKGPGSRHAEDEATYKDPFYARTLEISKEQHDKLKAFGDDPARHGFDLYYKDARNNCVDFTWAGLNQAGIHRTMPLPHGQSAPMNGKGALRPAQNVDDIRSIHAPIPGSPLNQEHRRPMPSRGPLQWMLSEQDHPGNSMFEQAYAGVQKLNAESGVVPSLERDRNFAGALAVTARAYGMQRIDHVLLSDPPHFSRAFVVEGPLQSFDAKFTHMEVRDALAMPLAHSSAAWERAAQQGDHALAQERAQTLERMAQIARQDSLQQRPSDMSL